MELGFVQILAPTKLLNIKKKLLPILHWKSGNILQYKMHMLLFLLLIDFEKEFYVYLICIKTHEAHTGI